MKPWVVWCINHRLRWAVIAIAVLSFPLVLVIGYASDAWGDIVYTIRNILNYKEEQHD